MATATGTMTKTMNNDYKMTTLTNDVNDNDDNYGDDHNDNHDDNNKNINGDNE
jgi:hypothetical protein